MSKAEIVNSWFAQRLGGSGALSRNTEAYNQVVGALPDLIARLDGAEAPADQAPDAQPAPSAAASPADPAQDPTPPEPATGNKG